MTKWTIPDDLVKRLWLADLRPESVTRQAADRIEALEAAHREILTEAPSLQYAQQIARDALYPTEGKP